ncbi:MAG: LysR family transcriptional regulator [Corynebacteriales bacterium]|nr:LysR family transcriptional regulator [Mycobacteriales bacterium]
MDDIDVRHLKSFLAVASELNITRAANRLHLTQQAVSSHIQQLERTLNVALLVRTSRGVLLTSAGEELLAGGKMVLDDLAEVVRRVRIAADEQAGTLRLGCCPYATSLFVVDLADKLESTVPGLNVALTSVATPRDELALLREGRADAAFMWLPIGDVGLRHAVIRSDSHAVVLPTRHRLAERSAVNMADISTELVLRPDVLTSEESERFWMADPRPDGVRAPYGPKFPTMEDALLGVARGRGIWLAPEPLSGVALADNLRWIPISDGEPFELAIVWSEHAPESMIARLIAEARTITGYVREPQVVGQG